MTSPRRSLRHRRCRGQALVELTLILPIMILLFVGTSTAATFLGDAQVAGQAIRAGARLAAEDGNGGYLSTNPLASCQTAANGGTGSPNDPCTVDNEVVQSVLTTAGGLTNLSALNEIDIYEPCAWSGQSCTATTDLCTYSNSANLNGSLQTGDPVDVYKYKSSTGTWTRQEPGGDTLYTLALRDQTEPSESPIGVRLVFTFQASAPMNFFNFQTSQYMTACLAPSTSGSL
ncbi:MAG: TadE family protein [Candidatus Dormibacteria bacterium]